MLKTNHYNSFFKLAKISLFLGLNSKNKDKYIKFKVSMLYNTYTFYDLWRFLIFFYKLRFIFKKIIKNKGFFAVLNSCNLLHAAIKFFFSYKKVIFFLHNRDFLVNMHFFKSFINRNKFFFIDSANKFKIISFIFLCLNRFNRSDKQKISNLQNQNIPVLFLSEFFLSNFYWVPLNFYDFKKFFFWVFLVFNVFFEEFSNIFLNEKK